MDAAPGDDGGPPERPPVGHDWRATSADDLAPPGDKHRLDANLEALRVLRQLDDEGRRATRSEQDVLARWSSWGSVPKVFDPDVAEFAEARAELATLLDETEMAAAARTTLNAHFTDFDVATSMWRALAEAGFTGGRVLEPGCGSGTFLATVPAGLDVDAVGVEVDPVTASIAKRLHPDATIRSESFGMTRYPDGWFDATVGNVPFGNYKVFDPIYNKPGLTIHNHFIAKSLRLTRPGGYVAVLTSRFTLDAGGTQARRELADLGDLVGAVRLPEGAMRRVAGTGVAMDLLMLRRREEGAEPNGEEWLETAPVETPDGPVQINQVFAEHPEWVLGTLRAEHGQYGQDDVEVRALDGPLAPRLDAVLSEIVGAAGISGLRYSPRPATMAGAGLDGGVDDAIRGPHHVEQSLLKTESGGFAMIKNGITVAHRPAQSQAGELALLIDLRETYFELVDTQAVVGTDDAWQAARRRLNEHYDRYTRVYGPVNRFREAHSGKFNEDGTEIMRRLFPPMGGFKKDPGLAVVRALENFDAETGKATKATLFERRVLAPRTVVESADSPQDALALCLDERGHVDVETIGRLLDCTPGEAREQLGTLVYDNPEGGPPLTAAQYLSGNVRARLGTARAAVKDDPRWRVNVEALEAVQPRDLEPSEIDARLGTSWIPPSDVRAFCAEVLEADVTVEYASALGEWAVSQDRGDTRSVTLTSEWGTERMNAVRLVDANANQRVVSITDEGPEGQRIPNLPATLAAREKQELLADRFGRWVWEDPERSARLTTDYNNRFNSVVLPTYDGSHLTLPGLAENFVPHPHQRDAVWRMLSEPSVLLAHAVGSGKTATMVIGGQELKRLGMITKPCYVVPNHMLEQFSREYMQLYPQAKILVGDKDDVSPNNRKEFIARCAADDWDAVIVTQSSFVRLPVSKETEQAFLDTKIDELRQSILESKTNGKGITVKEMEKALATAEERHKALVDDSRRDEGGVTWEASTLDYIVCDEAHSNKGLAVSSHIQSMSKKGSKQAEDMLMKMDWLREHHGNRVATFATATPIVNTIAEMYVMQRFLQPSLLKEAGVEHFDGWAANFARTVTALELSPDSSTYRMNTRFARFANVPDLLRMFREVADVRTTDQLDLPRPDLVGGKAETVVVDASEELRAYVQDLARRSELIRNRSVSREEDNMLTVSGDGRKAALDLRLVHLPPDPAGGKIATAADRIAGTYHHTSGNVYLEADGSESARTGALQIVFCDLGTPHNDDRWTAYEQLRADLAARGVPANEVRFIHEAKNDAQKARMFAAARAGSIAVLVGSSPMMGVGTNVQARAVALHHLDCPWWPSSLEQRDGRILRQGNQNDEVRIVRYVTEGSFDVFSWQTVERKAGFIDQVMRGDITERFVDDIGDQALSAAEVKALATGNPLIMERAGVESELTKLSRLQAAHRNDQGRLAQRVRAAERDAEDSQRLSGVYRSAAARAVDTTGDRFRIDIEGRSYKKRPEAGTALQKTMLDAMNRAPVAERRKVPVGELAGFTATISVSRDATETTATLGLEGVPRNSAPLSRSEVRQSAPLGLLARLENLAAELPERADREDERAVQARSEATKAAGRIGQPFEHTGRIESLRQRLAAIDEELIPADPAVAPDPADPATAIAPERAGDRPEVVVRSQPPDNRAASRDRPPLDPAVSLDPHDPGHGPGVVHQVPTTDSPNRTGPIDMATFGDAATNAAYPNKVTGEPGPAPSPRDHPEPSAEHQHNLPTEPSDELGG